VIIGIALNLLSEDESVPSLKKGQMIQVNTTCTNDDMFQDIKIWEDEDSYKKYPLSPKHNLTDISVPVY